jgi:hypothetical protein
LKCSNVLGEVLGIMEKFIEEKCVSRLGALERRDSFETSLAKIVRWNI